MAKLANKTLQTFRFYISAIEYFNKNTSHFIYVIDMKLTAESIMNNLNQVVTDSEEKKLRKKNKWVV